MGLAEKHEPICIYEMMERLGLRDLTSLDDLKAELGLLVDLA